MEKTPVAYDLWERISKKIFNETDPTLKIMFADRKAHYKEISEVEKSTDYDQGAISNELEFTKGIMKQLKQEFKLENATKERLDIFGGLLELIRPFENSPDDSFKERINLHILPGGNGTPRRILDVINPLLDKAPVFIDGIIDTAFYGLSFFDVWLPSELPSGYYPALYSSGTVNNYFEIHLRAVKEVTSEYSAWWNLIRYSYYDYSFYGSLLGSLPNRSDLIERIELEKASGNAYNIFLIEDEE